MAAEQAAQIKRFTKHEWTVPSQTEAGAVYRVKLPVPGKRNDWRCTCPDYTNRTLACKHIWAVRFILTIQTPTIERYQPETIATDDPPDVSIPGVSCKHCNGVNVTRYGTSGKKPAYWCKPCARKFVLDDGFKRLKGDAKVVTLALDLYFKGVSLRQITDTLEQFFEVSVGHVTIYNWLQRYVSLLNDYAASLSPDVGDAKWHADEMKVKYGADWRWLWHVMDRETRYLLVSKVTKSRDLADARGVFQAAKDAAGGSPQVIVTDGLPAYVDAAKRVFNAGAKRENRHEREIHLTSQSRNNNPVERLNGTVRARERAARGLKSPRGPLTSGQAAYYNLVRPHSALGKTPAEAAGLSVPKKGNRWKALIEAAQKNQPNPNGGENDGEPTKN